MTRGGMAPFQMTRGVPNMPQPSSGGGILAKILGRNAGLSSVQNAAAAPKAFNLTSVMTNVQKVLGVAERVTPMVQQYGPMVRNVPAMFKIYKALKDDNTTDDQSTPSDVEESVVKKDVKKVQKLKQPKTANQTKTIAKTSNQTKASAKTSDQTKISAKTSQPKLYI